MWIVYIRDGDLLIEEVSRETSENYYIKHSYSVKHRRVSKKSDYRLFKAKDGAYAFYDMFWKVWNEHRFPVKAKADALRKEGQELISKSSKLMRDFNKDAIQRLQKEYPEEFI